MSTCVFCFNPLALSLTRNNVEVSWNVQVFQRSLKGGNNPMKAEFNSFLLLVAMASNLVAMAST